MLQATIRLQQSESSPGGGGGGGCSQTAHELHTAANRAERSIRSVLPEFNSVQFSHIQLDIPSSKMLYSISYGNTSFKQSVKLKISIRLFSWERVLMISQCPRTFN